MHKNRSRLWMCLTVVIFAALYCFLLFNMKKSMDISAWALFAFTMVSFLLLIVQLAFGAGGIKEYPQFDYVNTTVACIYCGVQLVLGGIILMLFKGLPFIPVICTESILLAAYLVYTFILTGVSSHAESQDAKTDAALTNIRTQIAELETLAAAQSDAAIKTRLRRAAEDLRYQDVIVPAEAAALDDKIRRSVEDIRYALSSGALDANEELDTLSRLLAERKEKARAYRR